MKSFLFLSFIGLFSTATAQTCDGARQKVCGASQKFCYPGGKIDCLAKRDLGFPCTWPTSGPYHFMCKSGYCADRRKMNYSGKIVYEGWCKVKR